MWGGGGGGGGAGGEGGGLREGVCLKKRWLVLLGAVWVLTREAKW